MKKLFISTVVTVVSALNLGFMSLAFAGEINDVNGVAILGYDPIGYFTEAKPRRGKKTYSFKFKGSEWHFETALARDIFAKNPENYEPQFGGFCANGLSQGHKIEADPEIWLVLDGKLYMFFSERGRDTWINTDYKRRLTEAKETWQQMKHD